MTENHATSDQTSGDFSPGDILAQRYRVISVLGQGGMGLVYRVEQIFLRKELALKTIYKNLISDTSIRRFQAEAKAASTVDHPNIVTMHDFGLLDDHTPYLVMEIVNGQTLGDIFKTRCLDIAEALPIFIQLCFALAHAHDKHIIHRDIKPNNIMLLSSAPQGTEGSVKILDFGIAKLAQHDEGEIQALTKTGEIFGSPTYMSPEQCQGQKVDHRTDIYSLGCVVFEALTGTAPFVGDNALSTMMMHLSAKAPSLKEASLGKEFPPALESIVNKMLSKNPDHRYQNLGHAAMDLADLSRGEQTRISKHAQATRARTDATPTTAITLSKNNFALLIILVSLVSISMAVLVMKLASPVKQQDQHQSDNYSQPSQQDQGQANNRTPITPDQANTVTPTSVDIDSSKNKFELNVDATDSYLQKIKDNDRLQTLTVSGSAVTDKGMLVLKNSKILNLDLSNCENIRTAPFLDQMPYLQYVNLNGSGITDDAMTNLAKLKMLNEVRLHKCNVSLGGLQQLTNCQSVRTIFVDKDKFKPSDIAALSKKMPWCIFPGFVDVPYLTLNNLHQYIQVGALQKAPYQPPPEFAHMPIPVQAEIVNGIATTLSVQGRLREASILRHRASSLISATGDKKTLMLYLMLEAQTVLKFQGPKAALPLVFQSYPLLLETYDHSTPKFFDVLYGFTEIPLAADDYKTVQKYCDEALKYLHALRPSDTYNIQRFTQRKEAIKAI